MLLAVAAALGCLLRAVGRTLGSRTLRWSTVVAAGVVVLLVFAHGVGEVVADTVAIAVVAAFVGIVLSAGRAIVHPSLRVPMVAAGCVITLLLVADVVFGDLAWLGLPGFVVSWSAYYLMFLPSRGPLPIALVMSARLGVFGTYWAVNTALLGFLFAGGRWAIIRSRARTSTTAAMIAAALAASGCLSATPPKTPNQRAVERNAPHVVVPAPVGERTPRPASEP